MFLIIMENLSKEKIIFEIRKREKEIKDKFKVKNLFLFGSYAKNKQTENSDIDILVEFQEGEDDYSNELDLQVYFYNLFKKDIGLCEKNRLKKEYKPYILNENLMGIC